MNNRESSCSAIDCGGSSHSKYHGLRPLALHRALRRMAGLVSLLVFWVLAGACQMARRGRVFQKRNYPPSSSYLTPAQKQAIPSQGGPPEEKFHLWCCANQRNRAALGETGASDPTKPTTKIDCRGRPPQEPRDGPRRPRWPYGTSSEQADIHPTGATFTSDACHLWQRLVAFRRARCSICCACHVPMRLRGGGRATASEARRFAAQRC